MKRKLRPAITAFFSLIFWGLATWAGLAWPALAQQAGPRMRRPAPPGFQLAQVPERAASGDEATSDTLLDGVFLPPDRSAKRRLESARQRLEDKQFDDAVRYLGSLLEAPEDYFFRPDPRQPVYRSLKAEAGSLIGGMPEKGLESYELQFGARARRMLNEALGASDTAMLAEVSRRFFFTVAGSEATLLIARHHLDHGQPLAAALCLERLRGYEAAANRLEPLVSALLSICWLRADQPDKANQVLSALKQLRPAAELRIGDKTVQLFASEKTALAMLQEDMESPLQDDAAKSQWTLFRGDSSRNARSEGGRPLLNHRWRQHTVDDETIERSLVQGRQNFIDQDVPALPNLHPLAVGDVVLTRTWRNLLAVDFKTGKRVWQADPRRDDPFEQFIVGGRGGVPSVQALVPLQQRMWQDAAYGTLSSDGRLVFAIEELGIAPSEEYQQRTIFLPNGQRPRRSNKLVAYDLKTQGMLAWEVGGNQENETVEPKLIGAFFLGAPLPLQGKLYALAEMKGQEIRLVVLSADTGVLEWSQQLAIVEQNISLDSARRLAGAMPSYADGVLVCPTSAGAVVAIDLTTRSLLWGYQYAREQFERMQTLRMGMYPGADRGEFQHWTDATATVADGRVLLTPVESEQLYCLNLVDGKLLWKKERGTNLYVACAHKGNVILVGQHALTALELSTGKPAWQESLALPAGAMPSGRGFYSKGRYFLPMSIGEVAEVDLDKAAIVSRAKSRHRSIPGNLICFQDQIISQGVDYLDAYYQLAPLQAEVAETLKARPDDPKALARLGEVRMDEGRLAEAIDLFRRSYRASQDDYIRELLVASMLEGLRSDFAAHRTAAQEVEKLIDRPEERIAYLRLLAAGLQRQGEQSAAFDAYMKLAGEAVELDELDEIEESLVVRRDRWLGKQLASLYAAAEGAERTRIDSAIRTRLDAARGKGSADALRHFIRLYGGLPQGAEARESLLSKLTGKATLLEREALLSVLEADSDVPRSRKAVARLAALLREAGRVDQAADRYRQLLEQPTDQECLDGKTARQLVDDLPPADPVRLALKGPKVWPVGEVITHTATPRALAIAQRQRNVELETRGAPSTAFRNVRVLLDTQQQAIITRDALGNERFRVPLSDQLSRRAYGFGAFNGSGYPVANYFNARGNLMLLFMGNQLLALDTLRGQDPASSAILWSQDMAEPIAGMAANQSVQTRPINVPWGPTRYAAYDASGRAVGSLGPVSLGGVYFQRVREVLCVEPLSGKTLWTRKNLPPGSDLFGDDKVLFIAPLEGGEALVLDAADGRMLGKRKVPSIEQRMATFGRRVLTWQLENARPTLALVDAWDGTTIWTHSFDPGVKLWLSGQECVAVFEPNGRFAVFTLPDGRQVVDDKLQAERSLSGVYLLPSTDHFVLITKSHPRGSVDQREFYPMPGGLNMPVITGRVYCFDRHTGKRVWGEPQRIEQFALWLGQPSELPVLTFVRTSGAGVSTSRRSQTTSVLAIDKRTGRIVLQEENVGPAVPNSFETSGDPATNTVTLSLPGRTFTFTFTDKPLPPDAGKTNELGKIAGALLESLGTALERVSGIPEVPEVDDD